MPLLFSYGSLQDAEVQIAALGRRLAGERDELPLFEQRQIRIDDPRVASALGRTNHANVRFTGNDADRVSGMAFEVTDAEFERIDAYEAAFSYERISATLASGNAAWVYLHPHRD